MPQTQSSTPSPHEPPSAHPRVIGLGTLVGGVYRLLEKSLKVEVPCTDVNEAMPVSGPQAAETISLDAIMQIDPTERHLLIDCLNLLAEPGAETPDGRAFVRARLASLFRRASGRSLATLEPIDE